MCGIAGFWLFDSSASLETIRSMCDQIRYRGPDDEGFHVDGGCAIGMRRLSIIDLATGHQPISNEDRSVWIVFNGEIYNFQELRRRLLQQGHRFQTASDTETIVHLYEQEGVDGLTRLRGMFAFAIWDARRREILLARDRFGKKPLYYASTPQGLWFGSELKCLRAAGVPETLDAEALRLYFQFSYIPDPRTPFTSMHKLEPGTWLLARSDGTVRQGRYWRMPPPTTHFLPGTQPPAEQDVATSLRDRFDESVRIRMLADVSLGAFLSGGIDSSAVVASMALQSPDPIKTFSIGFKEAAFNELEYARMVARQYKTDHHELLVEPDSVSLVPLLVKHFDEPFGDTSAIPTFLVSQFAVQHVKVALSGDGGDELFAGYESFADVERRHIFNQLPQPLRRVLTHIADALPYSAYGKNYLRMAGRPTELERYFESNYAPYYLRKRLLAPEWMLPADAAFLRRTFPDCLLPEGVDMLSQALYFESTAKLTGEFLVKVDRMSMANSLEVRCPLLDHELAEYAAGIPNSWKLRNGKGKYIFLRAIGDRLPAPLLDRPKMGFGVPLADWFRTSLREMLWDNLTASRFLDRGLVSPGFLRYLLQEHQSGRRDNSFWLWQLLFLELWFREVEQPVCSPALAR
jgi:asparagine synthase (glutamine-hydrolysing)